MTAPTSRGQRAAHTPGPWFMHDFTDAVKQCGHEPSAGDVTVSCDHPATITVASMDRALTGTLDEARANARLIAAAPDLHAALRDLLDNPHDTAASVRAAAVLASVEGEQ